MNFRIIGLSMAFSLMLSSCAKQQNLSSAPPAKEILVSAVRPEAKTIYRRVQIPGTIEALWSTKVFAKVPGYLEHILVDHGDKVQKGQMLASLSSPEMSKELASATDEFHRVEAEVVHFESQVQRAKADLAALKAETDLSGVTLGRWKQLDQRLPGIVAQQQIDTLGAEQQAKKARMDAAQAAVESAQADVIAARRRVGEKKQNVARIENLKSYLSIRAPFTGVITKRFADPGALIQGATNSATQATPIVEIQSPETLRIYINVPEPDVPHVSIGRTASVVVDALPDEKLTGKVERISYAEDPGTRTMLVDIRIDNKEGKVRPGMFAHVSLQLERHDNVLTIPSQALYPDKKGAYLFIASENKAKKVRPKIGADDGINTEIEEGLSVSDFVLMPGQSTISDGDPVRIATSDMSTGGAK
jgi:RND family efflux transporter MFP subunit